MMLCLAIGVPAAAASQVAVPPPAAPDSVITPRTGQPAGYGEWVSARLASGRVPDIVAVEGGSFTVLLLSPLAARHISTIGPLEAGVRACREVLRLDESDSAAIVSASPWAAFDDATAARPLLSILVTPVQGDAAGCVGRSPEWRYAAIARALQFSEDTLYRPGNDVRAVTLAVDGRPVEPVLQGHVSVAKVGKQGEWHDGTRQVRLYVPFEEIAAVPGTRSPSVELFVWDAARSAPQRVTIPTEAIRRLWWDAFDAHIAGRVADPTDREAAFASVEGLQRVAIEPADRRADAVRLALALDRAGDERGARTALREQLDSEPCLAAEAPSDAPLRRIADDIRPAARCSAMSTPVILARSLVPGWGQYSSGRRGPGVVAAVFTLGAAAYGLQQHGLARAKYFDYEMREQADGGFVEINKLYVQAEDARVLGNRMIAASAGMWVATGALAVLHERRHARQLNEVLRYVGPDERRLSLEVAPAGGAVGIGVRLAFGGVR